MAIPELVLNLILGVLVEMSYGVIKCGDTDFGKSELDDVLCVKQLLRVFKLCDIGNTGRIQVNSLLGLAELHLQDQEQVEEIYYLSLAANAGRNLSSIGIFILGAGYYLMESESCVSTLMLPTLRVHLNTHPEIRNVLDELDPDGRGTLSFKEFCAGIRAIRRRQMVYNRKYLRREKESMMSPVTAAESVVGNGSTGPEPTFLLNPADSPQQSKSQCSSLSDGENYEWNGDAGDIDGDSGISNDRNLRDSARTQSPSAINRHTWLRTSLRRSSPSQQDGLANRRWGSFRHNGKRQLGSNALASSSFNSSGRSSTCDTADDMYSDASLEEDVHDLHHKFQVLQQQVGVLQDSAHQNDERYTRAKSDNAALQARVLMLEEQLRDTEMRYEARLQEEQKRTKEQLSRLEREKQLQLENASIRLHASEAEALNYKEEVARQRIRIEKLEGERNALAEQIQDLTSEVIDAKDLSNSAKEKERRLNQEYEVQAQIIDDLSKEIERLRSESRTPALPTTSPETIRLEELHEEMADLRSKNAQLQEANDELQASLLHAGLEQGRKLTAAENSLAAELEAMTHDEPVTAHDPDSLAKMQQALKEQQDVNLQLRCYIDGILLNIVENYPQLLEVKHVKQRST